MTINLIIVKRDGLRSLKSNAAIADQCNGSEWPRRANASFFGTLDVGERDE